MSLPLPVPYPGSRRGRMPYLDGSVIKLSDAVRPIESRPFGLADGGHDVLLIGRPVRDNVWNEEPASDRR